MKRSKKQIAISALGLCVLVAALSYAYSGRGRHQVNLEPVQYLSPTTFFEKHR